MELKVQFIFPETKKTKDWTSKSKNKTELRFPRYILVRNISPNTEDLEVFFLPLEHLTRKTYHIETGSGLM